MTTHRKWCSYYRNVLFCFTSDHAELNLHNRMNKICHIFPDNRFSLQFLLGLFWIESLYIWLLWLYLWFYVTNWGKTVFNNKLVLTVWCWRVSCLPRCSLVSWQVRVAWEWPGRRGSEVTGSGLGSGTRVPFHIRRQERGLVTHCQQITALNHNLHLSDKSLSTAACTSKDQSQTRKHDYGSILSYWPWDDDRDSESNLVKLLQTL